MNCAEFESRLNDEFDASSTIQAADLAEHAEHCAICRASGEGFRLLADGIGAWRQEVPDVDLTQAVVFALRQSACPMSQETRNDAPRATNFKYRLKQRWLALAVATSAALLVVLSLLPVFRRGPQATMPVAQVPVAQVPVAQVKGVQGEQATSTSDNDRLDQNDVDQRRGSTPQVAGRHSPESETDRVPYFDLAQRAAGALGQMTMLVLPFESASQDRLEEQPPAAKPTDWIGNFERELKPVGRSLGNAFDFLWRAGESADG